MKRLALFFCLALLFACDDSTTEVTHVVQSNMKVVAEVSDLPDCTKDNEGEQTFVKKENAYRICVDNKWTVTEGDTVYINSLDVSCSTELLKDSSGVKIVCNGDSIGVVLNGIKGETGNPGKTGLGCNFVGRTDTSVTIACGDSSMTFSFGPSKVKDSNNVEPPLDSEAIAISLDSLTGFTQKGPFIKGATVYLYELNNGYTLKQTNGNFVSNITRDDGRFKFTARDLVSQYVMLMVDGNYRNEVTGEVSKNPIQLKAISNMMMHKTANVNLLTHLEFERVYHLVTKEHYTVLQAKRKAQKEVLALFHIELDGKTEAEDMDVFGKSDADAALLAVSILLQGDRSESEMMALLTEISNDMAEKGEWVGKRADSIKVAIADWAFTQDFAKIRKNVEDWQLNNGNMVGNFEGVIEHFIMATYGLDDCDKESEGKERIVTKKMSAFYDTTSIYQCYEGRMLKKRSTDYLNSQYKHQLEPNVSVYGEMIDWRDRKVYSTIYFVTGDVWMAENLDYVDSVGVSWCYANDSYYCDIYGRLYTWSAAMDSSAEFSINSKGCGNGRSCNAVYPVRGICPEGWHLPTMDEWNVLMDLNSGVRLKATQGWSEYHIGDDVVSGNGNDIYGFSAIPGGLYTGSVFNKEGYMAVFWSSTEFNSEDAYVMRLDNDSDEAQVTSSGSKEKNAFSVRCVQNH